MLGHLRRNAVAYVALFVALGGVSYAATAPRNSIGTAQLKRGAVRSADIRANAVTSAKIKNRTIRSRDLAAGVLTQGPVGAQGPAGPRGADGAAGAQGAQGPPGPTEGNSIDYFTTAALVPDGEWDDRQFAVGRTGRVFVSHFLSTLGVICSDGGGWDAWLEVDGERVPGSIVSGVADASSITAVNFTGVTESALAAGDHSTAIAYNCVSGTVDSASGNQVGAVTSIVLG